ncbi:MAG: hypothetical protein ACRC0L_09850 [Angustibacter sp.]
MIWSELSLVGLLRGRSPRGGVWRVDVLRGRARFGESGRGLSLRGRWVRGGVAPGGWFRRGAARGGWGVMLVAGLVVAGCTSAPKQSSVDLFPSSSSSASPSVVGGPSPMPSGVRIDLTTGSLPKTLSPDQTEVLQLMQTYHEIFYGLYYDETLLKDFASVASFAEVDAAKTTLAGLKKRNNMVVGAVGVDVLDVTITGETGTAIVCNNFSDWHTYKKENPLKYVGTGDPEEGGYLIFVTKFKNKWTVESADLMPKCGVQS